MVSYPPEEVVMSDLDDLLSRLEDVDESRLLRATFRGRAVSRNEKNLHLAVSTGLISIPIEDIERVSVSDRDPAIVQVRVGSTARIRALRSRFGQGMHLGGGSFGQTIDLSTITEISVDTIDEDGTGTCDQSEHVDDDPGGGTEGPI
jgi:hypothetical protein